ncbi:MAG: ribosome small subunit-dependent GTPase A [Bacilli bacterium]
MEKKIKGKIIKIISNDFTVISEEGISYVCKARGKFRNMKVVPLVGDRVVIDPINNYILEIGKRTNELIRPTVANIDQLIIIASTKSPNFDTNLLDKLLCIAEFNQIKPIICLSKIDLLSKEQYADLIPYFEYYRKIGYTVIENTKIENIKELLVGKTTVFTGQSGAGKSTLLNKLDENLTIKTDEISKALGRGKHTTRHTELIPIASGWVADTPGFSSLEFIGMTKSDIGDNFIEFQELRDKCKYKDCMHYHDDGCSIKENVKNGFIIKSRYNNYIKFINGKD